MIAKAGKPVTCILPFVLEDDSHRVPGIDTGKVVIMPDFDAPLPGSIYESAYCPKPAGILTPADGGWRHQALRSGSHLVRLSHPAMERRLAGLDVGADLDAQYNRLKRTESPEKRHLHRLV